MTQNPSVDLASSLIICKDGGSLREIRRCSSNERGRASRCLDEHESSRTRSFFLTEGSSSRSARWKVVARVKYYFAKTEMSSSTTRTGTGLLVAARRPAAGPASTGPPQRREGRLRVKLLARQPQEAPFLGGSADDDTGSSVVSSARSPPAR